MWFVLHVMDYKQITTPCCNCQLLSLRKMNDWKIQKQIQKRREGKGRGKNRRGKILEKYAAFLKSTAIFLLRCVNNTIGLLLLL